MLSKAQGLGKKTAERIVVELKDKVLPKAISPPLPSTPGTSTGEGQDKTAEDNMTHGC